MAFKDIFPLCVPSPSSVACNSNTSACMSISGGRSTRDQGPLLEPDLERGLANVLLVAGPCSLGLGWAQPKKNNRVAVLPTTCMDRHWSRVHCMPGVRQRQGPGCANSCHQTGPRDMKHQISGGAVPVRYSWAHLYT